MKGIIAAIKVFFVALSIYLLYSLVVTSLNYTYISEAAVSCEVELVGFNFENTTSKIYINMSFDVKNNQSHLTISIFELSYLLYIYDSSIQEFVYFDQGANYTYTGIDIQPNENRTVKTVFSLKHIHMKTAQIDILKKTSDEENRIWLIDCTPGAMSGIYYRIKPFDITATTSYYTFWVE